MVGLDKQGHQTDHGTKTTATKMILAIISGPVQPMTERVRFHRMKPLMQPLARSIKGLTDKKCLGP